MDHRRETYEDRCFLAWAENLGLGQVRNVGRGDELSVGTRATRVNDTLWNTLTVKALKLLYQLHVLQERRACGSSGLGVLVVSDWRTVVTRQGTCIGRRSDCGRQDARCKQIQGISGKGPNGHCWVPLFFKCSVPST